MPHFRLASVFHWLLLLVGASTILAACSKTAPPEEPVRAVKVLTVGASLMQAEVEFAAEVRPRIESRLGFRVAGKLVKRHVELGQQVRSGQALADLDAQDHALALQSAQAQLSQTRTQLSLAESDYQRYKGLREQNFISAAELERRDTALKSAQAQHEQAQAQWANQKNQLGYTRLLADVAGVVTSVEAEPGQVLGAGAVVVRVAQDGPRDAVFALPEDRVGTLRIGQVLTLRGQMPERAGEAPVSGAAMPTSRQGVVRELAASADPVTRTYQVKLALSARDGAPLGSTLTVVLAASSPQPAAAIKLPTSALRQEGQATTVWLLDPTRMTVKAQTVEVAALDGNEVVVTRGLQPGMQVVATGVHVLSADQKVTLYQDKYKNALDKNLPPPEAKSLVAPAATASK